MDRCCRADSAMKFEGERQEARERVEGEMAERGSGRVGLVCRPQGTKLVGVTECLAMATRERTVSGRYRLLRRLHWQR